MNSVRSREARRTGTGFSTRSINVPEKNTAPFTWLSLTNSFGEVSRKIRIIFYRNKYLKEKKE